MTITVTCRFAILPDDLELIGSMIKDICYNNAVRYFDIKENL